MLLQSTESANALQVLFLWVNAWQLVDQASQLSAAAANHATLTVLNAQAILMLAQDVLVDLLLTLLLKLAFHKLNVLTVKITSMDFVSAFVIPVSSGLKEDVFTANARQDMLLTNSEDVSDNPPQQLQAQAATSTNTFPMEPV